MRLRPHQVSSEMLAALAVGGGGADAVRPLVAAQYSKHVLLVWGVMDAARAADHAQAKLACRSYELLADIQQRAPDAVEAVLRHPSVGGWGERTLRALRALPGGGPPPGDGRLAAGEPAQLAALAAAAAIRAGQPCCIEVPVRRGAIMLPSLGQVVLPPGLPPDCMANLRCTPDGARVIAGRHLVMIPRDARADMPGWRGLRLIRAAAGGMAIRLVIDDLDPSRMPTATDLGGRLDPAEADRWQTALHDAWALLVSQPGTTAEEIQTAIQVLTPLAAPARGQLSASSREVFGCAALSPPADGPALAVTLAHEVQHAKLAALLDLVTLTLPDDGQRYYAPWRDDSRPIAGLLHGTYAYLGVSGFWRWQRQHEDGEAATRAHTEFARWRDAATMATETLLASTRLTEAGAAFVSGMRSTLRAWADDKVPATAARRARRENEQHRALWRRRNGDGREPAGT
ncbi:MAG TPA: HEXXH motif domain-containing protein [Streptosporangiaceae bacterium]|nr:HEXXH motif domain-containing protein [Streptosporangiaceae bacterium]